MKKIQTLNEQLNRMKGLMDFKLGQNSHDTLSDKLINEQKQNAVQFFGSSGDLKKMIIDFKNNFLPKVKKFKNWEEMSNSGMTYGDFKEFLREIINGNYDDVFTTNSITYFREKFGSDKIKELQKKLSEVGFSEYKPSGKESKSNLDGDFGTGTAKMVSEIILKVIEQRTKDDVPLSTKQVDKPEIAKKIKGNKSVGGFEPEKESKIDSGTPDAQEVQPKEKGDD
jgi:6-pyruvoyl-tetrahydropterin synthase